MRRTLTWLVTLPFAAASVLLGHAAAYRVTGTPAGDVHGYLGHAPQVVLVLATVALFFLAADARARRRSPLPLAALAAITFVTQEHLERLVHTGHVPFLLTSPALWVGIVLQLPLAAAVWALSRRLAEHIATPLRRRPPRLARLPLVLVPAVSQPLLTARARVRPSRGPPAPS